MLNNLLLDILPNTLLAIAIVYLAIRISNIEAYLNHVRNVLQRVDIKDKE